MSVELEIKEDIKSLEYELFSSELNDIYKLKTGIDNQYTNILNKCNKLKILYNKAKHELEITKNKHELINKLYDTQSSVFNQNIEYIAKLLLSLKICQNVNYDILKLIAQLSFGYI